MKQNLLACSGKIDITPERGLFPVEYGEAGIYSGKAYQRLYLRVVILNNGKQSLAMLFYELPDVPFSEEMRAWAAEVLGCAADDVVISASTSRSVPFFDCRGQEWTDSGSFAERQAAYGAFLKERTRAVLAAARETLRPARLGYAKGKCCLNLNCGNRHGEQVPGSGFHPEGPSDRDLTLLRVDTLDGEVIALIYNYAMSANCMQHHAGADGALELGGDIPGRSSELLEQRLGGGAVAAYCCGAAQDQQPLYKSCLEWRGANGEMIRKDAGAFSHDVLEFMAEHLCRDVLTVNERLKTVAGTPRIWNRRLTYLCAEAAKPKAHDRKLVETDLAVHMLGDVAVVAYNGDLPCAVGMRLKKESIYDKLLLVTHTGNWGGQEAAGGYDGEIGELIRSKVLEMMSAHYEKFHRELAV